MKNILKQGLNIIGVTFVVYGGFKVIEKTISLTYSGIQIASFKRKAKQALEEGTTAVLYGTDEITIVREYTKINGKLVRTDK